MYSYVYSVKFDTTNSNKSEWFLFAIDIMHVLSVNRGLSPFYQSPQSYVLKVWPMMGPLVIRIHTLK